MGDGSVWCAGARAHSAVNVRAGINSSSSWNGRHRAVRVGVLRNAQDSHRNLNQTERSRFGSA